MEKGRYSPLFESRAAKGRRAYKIFAGSVFVAVCYICFYRLTRIPAYYGRWAWIGLSMAELWFVFSWFLSQFSRWNPVYNQTFKDRLSHRYDDKALPGVDVFVCTADPKIEPPIMVVNTVLSVMAYDYPPDKLAVYLSDDACSDLTFYALLEASKFAVHWLPFCTKFKVEPRSPQAYFSSLPTDDQNSNPIMDESFTFIKKEYEEMEGRIERASMHGKVPSDSRQQHTAFRQWDKISSRHDHPTILQILSHGNSQPLPTLVYLAREKNPKYHHNFKAGAMNALIRVSLSISNGSIMLDVDCDMYSNNSESVRDMLCFFLDEKDGKETAYVQYPQDFFNLTKNDLYATCFLVINEIDLAAMDGNGGPTYIGSGCFHRRDTLCGLKYEDRESINILKEQNHRKEKRSIHLLQESSKVLADCTYEDNTLWGKEIGVLYGFPVEDAATGAYIQSKGWKSKYFNPTMRKGFLGSANTLLLQALVQHKRWSEGHFLIFLSKLSPLLHGGRMPLKLRLQYSIYNLWAVHCLATLYYVTVPSFCLFQRISLFPAISSRWVIPFAYVFVSSYAVNFGEFLSCGGTLQGWWNEQRMWLFRRTTSFLFGFIDSLLTLMGIKTSGFVVTAKVSDDDVNQRYMKEVMEFGACSPMFIILATVAMFNLYSVAWRLNLNTLLFKPLGIQILLSGMIVFINLPIYEGLFFRKDNGKMPFSVTCKSVILALLASSAAIYL